MGHDHSHDQKVAKRALWICLGLNAAYLIVEFVGGLVFGSLALLADAVHMLSDVASLGIAIAAQTLMERPASRSHTYGLRRAEVMGALTNGVLLAVTTVWIVIEAVRRLGSVQEVDGAGVLVVAAVGLAINLVSARIIWSAGGRSLNMRGAYLHMLSDAAGSVAAIVAGISVLVWGADWVDPAASLLIAGLILWATWRLLRSVTRVLMESAPADIDVAEVEASIASMEGVESVHHLHVWSVASDMPALSTHVVLGGEVTLHEAQEQGDRIKQMLAQRFGIEHATLELECHYCET